MNKRMILALAVSLATAGMAPAALAAQQTTTVAVPYGDLDLGNRSDSAELMARLQRAALEACGASEFSVPDYRRAVEHSACYRHSVDRAVQAIRAPGLSDQ